MNDLSYQKSRNGPLAQEAIDFLHEKRLAEGWSYFVLGEKLGISSAFTHNILNKGMNISTDTYMTKVAAGINALKNGTPSPNAPPLSEASRLLEHSYHLREKLQVVFKLPADITSREAERLAQFVQSLAR